LGSLKKKKKKYRDFTADQEFCPLSSYLLFKLGS